MSGGLYRRQLLKIFVTSLIKSESLLYTLLSKLISTVDRSGMKKSIIMLESAHMILLLIMHTSTEGSNEPAPGFAQT